MSNSVLTVFLVHLSVTLRAQKTRAELLGTRLVLAIPNQLAPRVSLRNEKKERDVQTFEKQYLFDKLNVKGRV